MRIQPYDMIAMIVALIVVIFSAMLAYGENTTGDYTGCPDIPPDTVIEHPEQPDVITPAPPIIHPQPFDDGDLATCNAHLNACLATRHNGLIVYNECVRRQNSIHLSLFVLGLIDEYPAYQEEDVYTVPHVTLYNFKDCQDLWKRCANVLDAINVYTLACNESCRIIRGFFGAYDNLADTMISRFYYLLTPVGE